MARTIATALSMPLAERRMRWEAMMAKLRTGTIQQWFADFIDALQDSQLGSGPLGPVLTDDAPTRWPLRSVNNGARYHH
jgi:trehalose 6-phosphate synthase